MYAHVCAPNLFRITESDNTDTMKPPGFYASLGELRLSGNHTVTEYEISGEPYSQKSGWIKHTNERIFQVMNI